MREFRLINAPSGGPSVQDITKRSQSQRHFKTIHASDASTTRRLAAVTIKCIDKTDGTTVWEYGPGSFWRHHYGADAISGVVPDLAATFDKYAIAAGAYPTFNSCGNRNTATLTANVCEPLSVVKLNSLDGTTIESATLTGLFCDLITDTAVGLVAGQTLTNAAALSGGDFVIVGERVPFVEFVDFTSNGSTKEYVLHAHGLRDGNVYLKTRTSNETITIPFDSDATAVETLFEATSDCTAATVTGGPWPLLPITVEATWSASSGDISAISTTASYTATGTAIDEYDVSYTNIPSVSESLILDVTGVTVGSEWSFTFDGGGATFTYTSTTTDIADFITDLRDAMAAFKTTQGSDGFWQFANFFEVSGDLVVTYSWSIRSLTLAVEGNAATDTRRAAMCAAAYDTGTGEMTSAVGYEFGRAEGLASIKMFAETATVLDVTGLNVLGIYSIGSGPSNAVFIAPQLRNTGDSIKASTVEGWSISGGVWTRSWQVYCNAVLRTAEVIQAENGSVCIPIKPKRFDGVTDRTAASILCSDGTVTEVMTTYGSLSTGSVVTAFLDGSSTAFLSWGYDIPYQGYASNNSFRINADGSDTWIDESFLKIGATAFGSDGTSVFGISHPATERFGYDPWPDMTDSHIVGYFPIANSRSDEPQQFRFRFTQMPGVNYTSWLDWNSSAAEITTALETLLGSGNVDVDSIPSYHATLANSPDVLIEKAHLWITYLTDFGFTPGSGRIPNQWLSTSPSGNTIEVQTVTKFTSPSGIAAYSVSDASLIWTRPFGTALIGGATVIYPSYAWLEGDYVYAYGQLLENEL